MLAGPTQHLSSPPQNLLLLRHGQRTGPLGHHWAEHPSPRAARWVVLSFLKRPKPEIFLRDGRAGWEGSSQSVSQYHKEHTVRSLHAVHGLTLSVIRIFIRFDPSRRSRWLFNARLSLFPSKLHHIMAPGKCSGHYKSHGSSPLPPHPAPLLPKGRTVRHDSFPPSSAPRHQLPQPPCIFPLPTPLEKPPAFPSQIPSFAFRLGEVKAQRGCIPNIPRDRSQRILGDIIPS